MPKENHYFELILFHQSKCVYFKKSMELKIEMEGLKFVTASQIKLY